jgi:hypothetical protein
VNDVDSMAQDMLPAQDLLRGISEMSSGSGVGPVRERLVHLGHQLIQDKSPSTE